MTLNCCSAKALPVRYQVTAHGMLEKHVAKMWFVAPLSTKVVNNLQKSFMVAENGAVCPTSAQLLWLL